MQKEGNTYTVSDAEFRGSDQVKKLWSSPATPEGARIVVGDEGMTFERSGHDWSVVPRIELGTMSLDDGGFLPVVVWVWGFESQDGPEHLVYGMAEDDDGNEYIVPELRFATEDEAVAKALAIACEDYPDAQIISE